MQSYTPENMKKIFLKSTTNQDDFKQEKIKYCKKFNKGTLIDAEEYNTYLYKLDKNIFVVDCDNKQSYKYVQALIKKHKLKIPKTKSISNIFKFDEFKHHFYFNNNLNKGCNKGVNEGKLDLLTNTLIIEDSTEFNKKINLDKLPDLTEEFYNELWDFNKVDKVEKIPKGPILNIDQEQNQESDQEFDQEQNQELDQEKNQEQDTKNLIHILLQCMDNDRFINYNTWWQLLVILKEIDKKLFTEFNEFSKNCGYSKYNYNDVLKQWNDHNINNNYSNNSNKKTIYSLFKWAKEDNEHKYKNFIDKYFKIKSKKIMDVIINELFEDVLVKLNDLLTMDTNLNESILNKSVIYYLIQELGAPKLHTTDYSKIFTVYYKNVFVNNNNTLYFFNGVFWEKQINDSKINTYISFIFDKLIKMLSLIHVKLLNYNMKKEDRGKFDDYIKYITTLMMNLRNLKDGTTIDKTIKQIKLNISNQDIIFNKHPFLFCFNNKLYDIRKNIFIEPKPEYYISQTTGYDWIENYNNDKVENIKKLIVSILPNEKIREYYLTLLSTTLTAINIQKFIVASGKGGNGKSIFHELLLCMLGFYGHKLKNSVLLKELNNGASPEIANLTNKRGVLTSEPDANQRIKCSLLKELTGSRSIKARGLYKEEIDALLQNTFIMECNDIPKLNEVNEAIARRLIRIIFTQSFIKKDDYNNLDEDEKYKYGIINEYYDTDEFREDHRQALFIILCEYVNKYNANLPMPDDVKKDTKIYLNSSDDILEWIEEKYENTNNIKDTIKTKEIYKHFENSNYFNNLNKNQKREYNYKWFLNKLETNLTLSKYMGMDKDKIQILTKYKERVEVENEDILSDEENKHMDI